MAAAKYRRVDLVRVHDLQSPAQNASHLGHTVGVPRLATHGGTLPEILGKFSPIGEQPHDDELTRVLRPRPAVVMAQVEKIEPFYHARPGQFAAPLNDRQFYHVREVTPQGQWGWTYHLSTFGLYARNLADHVRVGDYVVIENPTVVTDPHPVASRGHDLSVWVGPTLQMDSKVTVLHLTFTGPLFSAHAGTRDTQPVVPETESNASFALRLDDEDEVVEPAPAPKAPNTPAQPPPPPPKRIYVPINECTSIRKAEYNVWAVITRVSRPVSATKGQHLMAQVFIQDPECTGTYGYADYQFSLLGLKDDQFPPLEAGYVIRIHHMIVQEWNGAKNGRVYDARSVLVVPGGPNDPMQPICRAAAFEFTGPDEDRVQALRTWWHGYQNLVRGPGQGPVREKRFEEISEPGQFDIYCQIVDKKPVQGSHHSPQTLLTITDGTLNSLITLTKNPDSVDDKDTQELASEGTYDMEITVHGHEQDVVSPAQIGDLVLLKGVHAHHKALFDSQEIEQCYGFFFTIPADLSGAKCLKIPDNHSRARQLKKRIQAIHEQSNKPQPHSEDMRSLEELMEEIGRSPSQPIDSQDTNMFPNSEIFEHVNPSVSPIKSNVNSRLTNPSQSQDPGAKHERSSFAKATPKDTEPEPTDVRMDEDIPSVRNLPVTENDLTMDSSSQGSCSSTSLDSLARPVVTRSRSKQTKKINTGRPSVSKSRSISTPSSPEEEDIFYSCPSQL